MLWALIFLILASGDEQAKFAVEGNVVNAVTGEPLRRAAIAMRGTRSIDSNASLTADAGGHFVITGLPAGDYSVSAEKPGFAHAAPIAIAVGPNQAALTIKLMPLGRISGKVVDDAGDPIMNANIQLFRAAIQNGRRQLQPAGNGITNDLGEFHVSSLPAGRYFVSATAQPELDGAAYARTFYGGGNDPGSASPIELNAGGSERADIRMRAVGSFAVRGTIVNLPENMHPYLNIARRGSVIAAGEAHATQVDSVSGKFEFRGVTPGDWSITAGCYEKGAQLFGTAEVVVSDSDADGLIVTLGKAIELEGSIHADGPGSDSINPRSVFLSLRPLADVSQPSMGAMMRDNKTFTMAGVQPGDYILVTRAAEPWYIKSAQLGGQDILNGPFTVHPGGTGPIEITLATGGGEINGTVVDGSSTVPNGVVLLLGAGPEKLVRLNPLGRFHFGSLAPGNYTAYAFPDVQDLEYTNADVMQRFSSARINVSEGARQQVELKLNRTVY